MVPVGDDQKQHIELSRDIAESFNRTFKEIFPLHKARIGKPIFIFYTVANPFLISCSVPSKRILSLRDATQKMSKSAPNASSRISITDQPDLILSRIKAAVTDSLPTITYDPKTRPGVSNLLLIWSALDASNRGPEVLAEEAQRDGWGMGKLKDVVGEVVAERLKPIKEEY